MLDDQRPPPEAAGSPDDNNNDEDVDVTEVREIHALTSTSPLQPQPPSSSSSSSSSSSARRRGNQSWELVSYRSPNPSIGGSDVENFTTMSREFNAMVVAGTTMQSPGPVDHAGADAGANLGRIGEEEPMEETNPLAIVPDSNPIPSPHRGSVGLGTPMATAASVEFSGTTSSSVVEVSVHQVKKEEVESKIGAWQTAEIAKINNRFKREDVVINGWESEQVEKATAWLKKVERKLDEKRARAMEKMQNEVAKARRKAEEKRASAEAKRGTKVAKVLELSNLLRAVGRAPSKRSIF